MSEDTVLPFHLPSVCRKKLSVGFDGGQLSSDAGVLLLRGIEKRLGIVARLASCLRDKRDPDLILHTVEEMLRLRMFAIAAGYEDANDCNSLRLRNPLQRGHRFRRKADSNPVITDSR